jgi:hypothetical protein
MIVITSQRTRCGCTPGVASVIDNLPGQPRPACSVTGCRSSQVQDPVAYSRGTDRLQLRGQFRFAAKAAANSLLFPYGNRHPFLANPQAGSKLRHIIPNRALAVCYVIT